MLCHKPLTRSRFLWLMGGMGAAPLCSQNPAARQPIPNAFAIPKSGSLMFVMWHWGDIRGIWNVDPDNPEWRLITTGYNTQFLLSDDRKNMYVSSAGPHQPYLQILDFTNRGPARSVPYPGPMGTAVHQMASSSDGKYLYVLTDALAASETRDPRSAHHKGTVVVYTFEIASRKFLPQSQTGPMFEDLSDAFLITEMARSQPPGALGYKIFDAARRVLWSGGIYSKTSTNPGGLRWSASPIESHRYGEGPWSTSYQNVGSPGTRRNYFLYADGHVAIFVTPPDTPGRLKEWVLNTDGGIDGMAPGHKMLNPALSADGRLLFVPIEYSENGFTLSRTAPVDRVSVYRTPYTADNDTPYFRKVQDLVFDKPIPLFQANVDGTILYTLDGRFVDVKTSRLLPVRKMRGNEPIGSVAFSATVVP